MLQEGASNVKKGSSICGLDPVLDDGNLRVGGRLRRTSVREESKHPAILAKNHHVSTVILRYIHEGRNHMYQLRKTYWITSANSAARKIISHCIRTEANLVS